MGPGRSDSAVRLAGHPFIFIDCCSALVEPSELAPDLPARAEVK